jgi:hypothetical protein
MGTPMHGSSHSGGGFGAPVGTPWQMPHTPYFAPPFNPLPLNLNPFSIPAIPVS